MTYAEFLGKKKLLEHYAIVVFMELWKPFDFGKSEPTDNIEFKDDTVSVEWIHSYRGGSDYYYEEFPAAVMDLPKEEIRLWCVAELNRRKEQAIREEEEHQRRQKEEAKAQRQANQARRKALYEELKQEFEGEGRKALKEGGE